MTTQADRSMTPLSGLSYTTHVPDVPAKTVNPQETSPQATRRQKEQTATKKTSIPKESEYFPDNRYRLEL